MTGARGITQFCCSPNLAGIVANKIEQSFYSVYSYSGIEFLLRYCPGGTPSNYYTGMYCPSGNGFQADLVSNGGIQFAWLVWKWHRLRAESIVEH